MAETNAKKAHDEAGVFAIAAITLSTKQEKINISAQQMCKVALYDINVEVIR